MLKEILSYHSLRLRGEWVAKRVFGLDALVANPKMVETGLNLVDFSFSQSKYPTCYPDRPQSIPGQFAREVYVFARVEDENVLHEDLLHLSSFILP